MISALIAYSASGTRQRAVESVAHTREVLEQLENVLSSLKDAETGQRGYLLTGETRYLRPFETAQSGMPAQLQGFVG